MVRPREGRAGQGHLGAGRRQASGATCVPRGAGTILPEFQGAAPAGGRAAAKGVASADWPLEASRWRSRWRVCTCPARAPSGLRSSEVGRRGGGETVVSVFWSGKARDGKADRPGGGSTPPRAPPTKPLPFRSCGSRVLAPRQAAVKAMAPWGPPVLGRLSECPGTEPRPRF